MIHLKDNKRYYFDYKINSLKLKNKDFKYDLNLNYMEKIFMVLNQARHEFYQPCVAHMIFRN